jgi:hypothetical protein
MNLSRNKSRWLIVLILIALFGIVVYDKRGGIGEFVKFKNKNSEVVIGHNFNPERIKIKNPFSGIETEVDSASKGAALLPVITKPDSGGSEVINIVDLTTSVREGKQGMVRWVVETNGDVEEALVFYDDSSHEQALGVEDSPDLVGYTERSEAEEVGENEFEGMFSYRSSGMRFLRVYARVGDKHYWSKEIVIDITP